MDKKQEFEVIAKICDRAEKMRIVAASVDPRNKRLNLMMDIDNAHKDVGINLVGLLEADDLNFAHDVIGIQAHMNRSTGKLEDCFVPRYAKQDVEGLISKAVEQSKGTGSGQEPGRDRAEHDIEQ